MKHKIKKPKFNSIFRQAVVAEMKSQGMRPSELMRKSKRSRNRVYEFISGRGDMMGEGIQALMKALGLQVMPRDAAPPEKKAKANPPKRR